MFPKITVPAYTDKFYWQMCDKKYELANVIGKFVANVIGKFVRLSHNNNNKGLATNNVSRETIGKPQKECFT